MALSDEIKANYIDGNGLVTPDKATIGIRQGSDNGVMYSSEYYVMLFKRLNGLSDLTKLAYWTLLSRCIDTHGLLHRVPTDQESSQEGPDDYYGVLNACMTLGFTDIPRGFLRATVRFMGCFNNVSPGTWTEQSFLIRQPQLLCAIITASFPTGSLWHRAIRQLFWPLYLISAIIIATSCIGISIADTDSRRLAWHLQNTLKPVSLMCRVAAWIWMRRLYRDYGPTGMRAVAAIYYHPPSIHPFSKYWVD